MQATKIRREPRIVPAKKMKTNEDKRIIQDLRRYDIPETPRTLIPRSPRTRQGLKPAETASPGLMNNK